MKFAKTHALSNDFVIVDRRADGAPTTREGWARLALQMCDRHCGVGADGLVVLDAGANGDFSMSLLNQDGSEAEISGNGLRCLGAYLRFSGRAKESSIRVKTGSGVRELELCDEGPPHFVFRAAMGAPRLASADIPFSIDPPREPVVAVPLVVDGRTFRVTVVSMGNPHCVLLMDELDRELLLRLGPRIEKHERFPQKSNVELVEVRSRSEIGMRIWERGAGETGASGTGAAAAVVATVLNERTDEIVTVHCPGGDLEVSWADRGEVFVTGEAVVVAEGRFLTADG